MLAQYVSHDNKTLRYIEHALYRLENTKIAFEHHQTIDSKLYQPTFNHPKFHLVTHFAQCIRDYGSAVNYDTAHSKAAHKYLLKAFYNSTNKKEYDAQIRQYNVRHTNVIAMKNVTISKKSSEKEEKLVVRNADKILLAKVGKTSSPIDLDGKYMWAISNVDIDMVRDLGLTGIRKHWRLAGQIEKVVNGLHRNQIPALATFVKHSQKAYNNEKVIENMKIRQDIDTEWASSLFVQLHGSIHCQKMDRKDIANVTKLVNKLVRCSLVWGIDGCFCQNHIQIGGKEPIHEPINERKPQNRKQIRKLLLIMTVADPERFTAKSKPITYTGAFVELYKQKNRGQVHEIHRIVKLDKQQSQYSLYY